MLFICVTVLSPRMSVYIMNMYNIYVYVFARVYGHILMLSSIYCSSESSKSWKSQTLKFYSNDRFRILFEGIKDYGKGNIAIDDISVRYVSGEHTSFIYLLFSNNNGITL